MRLRVRVRPGEPNWPTFANWEELRSAVGGRLLKPVSPFAACEAAADGETCRGALAHIKNPYYIGDEVALTQTSGWADAWQSQPSAYAVAAQSSADVVAAVNFARTYNLRLVVKGGGHSYQGTSQAPGSLLVWMRHMNAITMHDAFVAQGCNGDQAPQPAVTIEAGALWIDAYCAVTTKGGRYVQGGGCASVGVAGLVQSGGFGSFSKNYGSAAAGLLEAEVVTADGMIRIVNACRNSDLFWALKGGGGGSFGVVTRVTLRTRELPEFFGAVFGAITASSDEAYKELIAETMSFYRRALFDRHWGEQIVFRRDNTLHLSLVFQGLTQAQAQELWGPYLDWVRANKAYAFSSEVRIFNLPARHFWDAAFLKRFAPQAIVADDRADAAAEHFLWAGDQGQVGWFVHGYQSAWLPESLLIDSRRSDLVDALFASSRHWSLSLHFNKGLAGAPAEEIAAARNTATNPQMLDAFALAIIGADGPPAYEGLPGASTDLSLARYEAAKIDLAANELRRLVPDAGAYVSESNFFQPNWQRAFWGSNYAKLAGVKHRFDPGGLFYIRHGVGSESWSEDGFTPARG
jgi:FAD/FMN-containing dehydrogenase